MSLTENKHNLLSVVKALNGNKHIKKTHSPKVTPIVSKEQDGNFDKFGGLPSFTRIHVDDFNVFGQNFDETEYIEILNEEYFWPKCQYCKVFMTFFFQVTNPFKAKTYQMFMCTQCQNENDACINEIDYKKCYNFNDLINGNFEEKVFIDDSEITKKYEFSKEFTEQIKTMMPIAYDHKITDQEYYSHNLNLNDVNRRDNKKTPRYFRSYAVSHWEETEEVDIDPKLLLNAFVESPLADKLPPWICQCKHPERYKDNGHIG